MKQQGVPIVKQLELLQFTCSVSHSLAEATIRRKGRGRSSIEAPSVATDKQPCKAPEMAPLTDMRTDSVNHWHVHRPDHPRCFHCGEKTRMGSEKCKKVLFICYNRKYIMPSNLKKYCL